MLSITLPSFWFKDKLWSFTICFTPDVTHIWLKLPMNYIDINLQQAHSEHNLPLVLYFLDWFHTVWRGSLMQRVTIADWTAVSAWCCSGLPDVCVSASLIVPHHTHTHTHTHTLLPFGYLQVFYETLKPGNASIWSCFLTEMKALPPFEDVHQLPETGLRPHKFPR